MRVDVVGGYPTSTNPCPDSNNVHSPNMHWRKGRQKRESSLVVSE